MSPWLVLLIFGLIKLPIAAMLLALPFRNDPAMIATEAAPASSDEEGGSHTPPQQPRRPRPRWPLSGGPGPSHARRHHSPRPRLRRRGVHGAPPPSPRRVRTPSRPQPVAPGMR